MLTPKLENSEIQSHISYQISNKREERSQYTIYKFINQVLDFYQKTVVILFE